PIASRRARRCWTSAAACPLSLPTSRSPSRRSIPPRRLRPDWPPPEAREESIRAPTRLYSDARGRSGRTGCEESMRVGFVGLGAMGTHMARNLHRADMLAAVWNRSAAKARTLASELNVAAPATLEQLAAGSDAVVSCVSADADVLEVARGLAPGVKSGALMLDCSTIGAEFARAQELPLEKLIDTLGKGAGSSWYFVHRAPNMVRGSYPAGFRVRLHEKDLGICRDMAARFGVALPLVERMLAEYAELVARGYGDEDISATYRLKAELFERTNIMGAPARGP